VLKTHLFAIIGGVCAAVARGFGVGGRAGVVMLLSMQVGEDSAPTILDSEPTWCARSAWPTLGLVRCASPGSVVA
jgi:hypothetical protein